MRHGRRLLGVVFAVLALASGPASADYARGKAAYEQGDFATALKEWTAGAKQGEGLSLFGLGRLYQAEGRTEVAEKMLTRAIQLQPDSVEALRELRLLHMRRSKSKGIVKRILRR